MEGENLGIVLPEGGSIHVVEDTDLTKDLLDPLGRPGVEREPLDADFDMVEPVERTGLGFQPPRMNLENSGADGDQEGANGSVSLLWIVEANKKFFWFVRGNKNVPLGKVNLSMQLVGHGHCARLR
jgi:hypothetical protein